MEEMSEEERKALRATAEASKKASFLIRECLVVNEVPMQESLIGLASCLYAAGRAAELSHNEVVDFTVSVFEWLNSHSKYGS